MFSWTRRPIIYKFSESKNWIYHINECTFNSNTSPAKSKQSRVSVKLHQAHQHLRRCYNIWNKEGKPRSTDHPLFSSYRQARSKVQQVRRHERNMRNIRTNNKIMQANHGNKNLYFKMIKNIMQSSIHHSIEYLPKSI